MIVLKVVVTTGLPAAPVGVIVSMLSVVRVTVTGSVAVAVIVTVEPESPGIGVIVMPPRDGLVVLMLVVAVMLTPGG